MNEKSSKHQNVLGQSEGKTQEEPDQLVGLENESNHDKNPERSKIGAVWVALAIFVFILILLIIFILQNSMTIQIHYFGAKGTLQFGVAMLIAAVAGSLLTLLIGSARIIQLKPRHKK